MSSPGRRCRRRSSAEGSAPSVEPRARNIAIGCQCRTGPGHFGAVSSECDVSISMKASTSLHAVLQKSGRNGPHRTNNARKSDARHRAIGRQSGRCKPPLRHTGRRRRGTLLLVSFAVLFVVSCAPVKSEPLGIHGGRLASCPSTPNCVCSDDHDEVHRVAPYRLSVAPGEAWQGLRAVIDSLPRTHVVTATGEYLRVEFTSLIFRFVDDLELHLRPDQGIVAVRSASRVGYSDLGVNRRRVEEIRRLLRSRGVVENG